MLPYRPNRGERKIKHHQKQRRKRFPSLQSPAQLSSSMPPFLSPWNLATGPWDTSSLRVSSGTDRCRYWKPPGVHYYSQSTVGSTVIVLCHTVYRKTNFVTDSGLKVFYLQLPWVAESIVFCWVMNQILTYLVSLLINLEPFCTAPYVKTEPPW